jgi:hypothetical protein
MRLVCDRLNSFLAERKVTRQQLADALSTKVRTVDSWRYAKRTPPSAVIALLDLIENDSRVRTRLGLVNKRDHHDKGGFQPGNPWRIGSPTREAAIAEARARKRKKAKD